MASSDETHFLTGIGDHDINLIFFVNKDAYPSVVVGDVTLELNGSVWNNRRISLELLNSTIVVSINHLHLSDAGNYTVTVMTASGTDSAWTFLKVHGLLLGYN